MPFSLKNIHYFLCGKWELIGTKLSILMYERTYDVKSRQEPRSQNKIKNKELRIHSKVLEIFQLIPAADS